MATRKKKRGSNSNSKINRIKSGINRKVTTLALKAIKTSIRSSGIKLKDGTTAKRIQRSSPQQKNTRDKGRTKPTFDIGKGRLIYPQKGDDGKVKYLPKESAASKDEIKKGLFIKEDKREAKEIAQGLKRKYDIGKGRFIYPVKDANGNLSYLPKESEASSIEKGGGQFVKDTAVVQKVAPNLKAKYDIGKGRYIFPVEGANNTVEYLPKRDDASKFELANGQFVENGEVKDLGPKQERRIRRAKPKSASKPEPPALDAQGRRNLNSRPMVEASDGTELWDSKKVPEPSIEKERKMLKSLKPTYDIAKKRMIYPVENENGKTEYLPLKDEASKDEIKKGLYADFVPPEGLQKFIKDKLPKKELDVDGGKIKAIPLDDLETALSKLPMLVLRSHKSIAEKIENEPALKQEWV